MLNQIPTDFGIPAESQFQGFGIIFRRVPMAGPDRQTVRASAKLGLFLPSPAMQYFGLCDAPVLRPYGGSHRPELCRRAWAIPLEVAWEAFFATGLGVV
jgi:hypothetical protein